MEMTPRSVSTQGVVLVVIDNSKEVSSSAINWALENAVRNGDLLRLVGVITHVQNPIGFMSRVDKNTWAGSSRRSLETEIANKRYMLHNIQNLDNRCKKAGVQLSIDVCVGQSARNIVVDEARNSGAYHVVVDKTMKKDRKFFIENLTCFVTRVRSSGGAESIRSFAVSKPTPQPPAGGPTPFNTQITSSFYMPSMRSSSQYSKTSSESGSSLHGGSSVSSTTFNQMEHHRLGKHHSVASTMTSTTNSSSLSMGFDTQSSFDDLFSINHESIVERDDSLCFSIPLTPDHPPRPDIPRSTIPRPQYNHAPRPANAHTPPDNKSHNTKQSSVVAPRPTSGHYRSVSSMTRAASGEVSERSFENGRNTTLSRPPLGDVGGGLSEGTGRYESARASPQPSPPATNGWTLNARASPQPSPPAANGWAAANGSRGRSSPQGAIPNPIVGSAAASSGWSGGSGRQAAAAAASLAKTVWVWTKSKDVMRAAVDSGWTTFVFTAETRELAYEWTALAKIIPLYLEGGQFVNSTNNQVAVMGQVALSEQVESLDGWAAKVVVMSPLDWQIIPAEIMVAAFQDSGTALYATASTASDARVYLGASEKGTDGIVLQTDDVSEVFALKAFLKDEKEPRLGIALVEATVCQVESVGMGDRVCVDLCHLLHPGEGLLVGSFARALFLVHSECLENNYTASRSFRVNAGPVHAYVGMAGGRTEYLSELHTGSQVLVVDALGHTRSVLVGRVKIESKPLLLVEVEVDSQRHSVLLQNTETVCLVAPGDETRSKAVPVTSLKVGDKLLLSLQEEARHTGIHIEEFLMEK